jgi:predicted outer membrane repeat protein
MKRDLINKGIVRMAINRSFLIGIAIVLAAVFIAPSAFAASINVDSTADNLIAGDGLCTLREAIRNANADSDFTTGDCASGTGFDSIFLVPGSTYKLTLVGPGENGAFTGDLDISDSLLLDANGPPAATIEGVGDRVFDIQNGTGQVLFFDLIITKGSTAGDGGGVNIRTTSANTQFTNVTITDNEADGHGGGIACRFCNTMLVEANSVISKNTADADGDGVGDGGGIYIFDINFFLRVNDSTIGGDTSSRLADKNTAQNGAGIAIEGTSATVIDRTTISGNEAENNGGGLFASTTASSFNIVNTTISGNRAKNNGGGIFTDTSGTAGFHNSTITNNTADSDNRNGGDGGGVFSLSFGTSFDNTILAQNIDPSSEPDCSGSVTSSGNNIIGINNGCEATFPIGNPNGNNDFVGAESNPFDPRIEDLESGVHLLNGDSAAIDNGKNQNCVSGAFAAGQDQRTLSRPVSFLGAGLCDIGAIELQFFEKFSEEQSIRVSQGYQVPFHCGERRVTVKNGGDKSIKIEQFESLITVLFEESRISTTFRDSDQAQNVQSFTLNNPSVFVTPGTMSINVLVTQNPGKSYRLDCATLRLYPITLDENGDIATNLEQELDTPTQFFQGNLTIQSTKTLRILVKKIKRTWFAVPDGAGSTFTNGKHELIEDEIFGERVSGSAEVTFHTSRPALPVVSAEIPQPQLVARKSLIKFGHLGIPGSRSIKFQAQGVDSSSFEIAIYDLTGRKVVTRIGSGSQLRWSLRNSQGRLVANGIYLYRITVRDRVGKVTQSEIKKLIVLR